MRKFSEYGLKIGTEYYLDVAKINRGVLIKIERGQIFFKATHGKYYEENGEGLIPFRMASYKYETV